MLFCPSFTQSERFLQTDQLITRHDKLHSRVDGKRDRERVHVRCSDLVGSDLPQGEEEGEGVGWWWWWGRGDVWREGGGGEGRINRL